MLGKREPDIYGSLSLDDINLACQNKAKSLKLICDFRQSNTEGQLIDWIQDASAQHQAIIINAGAYTHTSVAIRDALLAVSLPIIEVHLSNIFKREEFRHHSFISDIARGVICGFGLSGYLMALEACTEFKR